MIAIKIKTYLTFNTVTFVFPVTAWKPDLICRSSGNKNALKMITN